MSSQNQSNLALSEFLKFDSSIYQIFNEFSKNCFKANSILRNEMECPICYSEPKMPTKPNNCAHIFCFRCISRWFKLKKSCPCCRTRIDKLIKI